MAEQAEAWAELAAGPASPASFTALANADATTLSGGQLVDAIVCSEKLASLALGVQTRLMAALAVPFVAGDPMRLAGKLARRSGLTGDDDYQCNVAAMVPEAAVSLAAGEIAAALLIAPVTAGNRVRQAVHLTEEFTPARQALEDGVIDRGKLYALLEQIEVLPAEQVGPVLDQVLPEAADRCTSEIRDIAAQAVITSDPQGAADRHRQAANRRDVKVTPLTDAMATLKAFLPADGAVKIFQVSDLLATATAGVPGDARGIGARRADALVDLADRLLSDGHVDLTGYLGQPLPDHGQPRPAPRLRRPTTGTDCPAPANTVAIDPADAAEPAGATDPCPADSPAIPAPADPTAALEVPAAGDTDSVELSPFGQVDTDTPSDTSASESTASESTAPEPPASAGSEQRAGRVMSRQGRRPHLTVTMSLDTLAGLDDLPALLAGFGTVPAELARTIAASAGTITAAITDPATGAVTTAGELTYRPRQAVRDKVGVLTDTCQFPSCRQPVWRCDADHRDRFNHRDPARGGRTHECNMGALCRRHHLFKDHADWQVRLDPSRLVINWTSPTGHTYQRRARQTTPPEAWIRTGGTSIAEHLDRLATMRAWSTPTPAAELINQYLTELNPATPTGTLADAEAAPDADPPGSVEDRLTDALLRHSLNNPTTIEYIPDPDDGTHPADPANDPTDADDFDDDPPPF